LPPFIDGSCRREPDFESALPSITATCRAGHFVPRLQVGDRVAYLSIKRKKTWRLVAVLRVVQRFPSHADAAVWYRGKGLQPPSNCFVDGNPPKALEFTNGRPPKEIRARGDWRENPDRTIRLWDRSYRARIQKWPMFLACRAEHLELTDPMTVDDAQIVKLFGYVPATQNPPRIDCNVIDVLVALASNSRGIHGAPQ
jgi:hypothetical protein